MEWSNFFPEIIYSIVILAGLLVHYTRSETSHNLRYNQLKEYLDDHDTRIADLEKSKTQTNGQSTYITRPEYLRGEKIRNEKCTERGQKIRELCNKVSDHDISISLLKDKA